MTPSTPRGTRVSHIGIAVEAISASLPFFRDVLGLTEVALDDVNSPDYDSDATLSPDLGTMMFSSTRSGNAEIYETRAIQ